MALKTVEGPAGHPEAVAGSFECYQAEPLKAVLEKGEPLGLPVLEEDGVRV